MSLGEERPRRAGKLRHADRVLARATLLLLLGVFTLGLGAAPTTPAAELSFQVASASLRRGAAPIGGTPEARRLLQTSAPGMDASEGAPVVESLFEEQRAVWPGEVLVALPFHVLGGALGLAFADTEARASDGGQASAYFAHLLAGWRGALFTALLGFLLTLATRRLGCSRRVALTAGVSFGLTTFAGPLARGFVVEQQVALGLFAALYLLMRVREARGRGRGSHLDAAGFGLALAMALTARPSCWPAALVLAFAFGVWAWRGLSTRRALRLCGIAAAGPVLAGALLLLAEPARFQGIFLDEPIAPAYSAGVWGALISPGAGLVFFAPGVLLLAVGAPFAWRLKRPFLLSILVALVLALSLPTLLGSDPYGGWSFGPRPMLAALPFIWIGVAFGLQAVGGREWGRALIGLVLGFGLFVQLSGWLVDARAFRELSLAAGPVAFEELEALEPIELERDLARRLPAEPGFAAPWAHWRILRHRVAGMGESFPVSEVFLLDEQARVEVRGARERGFRHLAWVDLVQRAGGAAWPALLLAFGMLFSGALLALRGLDSSAP